MNFNLIMLPKDEESDFLSSHFLGCPDVPSIWNEKAEFYNDEIFLLQINLKEYPINDLKDGLLYFFIASKSHPYRGIVRYSLSDKEMERIDFNSEIEFKYDLNKEYLLKEDLNGEIQILPDKFKLKNYILKQDELILASIKHEMFNDIGGEIVFLIKKNDLNNHEFNKAYLSISLDK